MWQTDGSMASLQEGSVDSRPGDNEISVEYLRTESSSNLLSEALSQYLPGSILEPEQPERRLRPVVGKSLRGRPQFSEWSQPFVAERSVCAEKVRKYVVHVAEELGTPGGPFGIFHETGFGSPLRKAPMTLPAAVFKPSGSLTSRPSTGTREVAHTSPALTRFPALRSTGLRPPKGSTEAVEAADQAADRAARREVREPGFVNEMPWLSGAAPKEMLQRQPGGLHDPDDEDVPFKRKEQTFFLNTVQTQPNRAKEDIPGKRKEHTQAVFLSSPQGSAPASPSFKSPALSSLEVEEPTPSGSPRASKAFQRAARASAVAASTARASKATRAAEAANENIKRVGGRLASKISRQGSGQDTMASLVKEAKLAHRRAEGQRWAEKHMGANGTGKRSSIIWKLHHKDTKADRMLKVNSARRAKYEGGFDSSVGYRDRVSRSEVEVAQECFHRYFHSKSGNTWNHDKMLEALADFGVRAQNRSEKLVLNGVLKEHEEERSDVGFNHFCSMVEEARVKLRAARSMAVFQAWKYVDFEGEGALDSSSVMRLLENMNLAFAPGSIERHYVESMASECTTDPATGLISFGEVEYLVSAVREYMVQRRRRLERELQKELKLSPKTFLEFRSQLLSFHDYFKEFDDDGNGTLETEEALNLLNLFGCLASNVGEHKKLVAHRIVEQAVSKTELGRLTFAEFLDVVRTFRSMEMDDKMEMVQTLFNQFDHDRSGDLSIKEICIILIDLQMQPKSLLEQEAISQLIDEADADGSGHLNVHELLVLVQRITERVAELQRQDQNMKAKALGFSLKQANTLRRAFDALDGSGDGFLGVSEVEHAMVLMEWYVSPAKLNKIIDEVDSDGSGQLDFIEFLGLMRRVDDEIQSSGNSGSRKPTQVDFGGGNSGDTASEQSTERSKRRQAVAQAGSGSRLA
eukprot:TRINITY_DN15809_c0_g2_i1.p1 TRINITY_DN15809_c0_g2~~TRINITY_DN15809_c0_g2_i1.p1  ORF type:complete len:919 (+),score=199.07 TRINITY_DN15809_c0_g2_i1:105-2861(+)